MEKINLVALLIQYDEGLMANEERQDLYSCSSNKLDHRLKTLSDPSSFMKAFSIYKSVRAGLSPETKGLDV